MTKKKEVLSTEEKFFLNLNEEVSLDVEFRDFMFTLSVPELLMEATVSLGALRIAQTFMQRPEYAPLLESVTLPRFETKDNEDGEEEVKVGSMPLDLSKIQHVRYAMNFFPEEFVDTVNNIAYLNIVVSDIQYKGKEVWIQVDGEDVHVDTFDKFIKYVRVKNVRFGTLVDKLIGAYRDWLDAIEVTPQEVKN